MARFRFKDMTAPEREFYLTEAGFTPRQEIIFKLKCQDKTSYEICEEVGISSSVLSCEIRDIKEKMRRCSLQCQKPEYFAVIESMPKLDCRFN